MLPIYSNFDNRDNRGVLVWWVPPNSPRRSKLVHIAAALHVMISIFANNQQQLTENIQNNNGYIEYFIVMQNHASLDIQLLCTELCMNTRKVTTGSKLCVG
jgi:hypothetical protein